MHDLLNVVLLALVQGLTEFLPVSSSGHLVIAQHLLGVRQPGVSLEIWLHVGTLASILIFYRQSIRALLRGICAGERHSLNQAKCLAVSTLPAVIFYACFHRSVESAYESTPITGGLLIFTGVVLLGTRWIRCCAGEITPRRALITGVAQALAILPGVSRSGMTISAARASGISPVKAAEFSFLMVIPLLVGAALVDLLRMPPEGDHLSGWLLALGAAVAAAVGFAAIKLLVLTLKGGRFWMFGVYCIAAGVLTLLFL